MTQVMSFVVAVVDRIACTGFGEICTSRVEYKKLLRKRKKLLRKRSESADLAVGWPTALGKPFTDRARAMGWTPLPKDTTGAADWDGVTALLAAMEQEQSPPALENENGAGGKDHICTRIMAMMLLVEARMVRLMMAMVLLVEARMVRSMAMVPLVEVRMVRSMAMVLLVEARMVRSMAMVLLVEARMMHKQQKRCGAPSPFFLAPF